ETRVLAGPSDVPRALRALPDGQVAAISGNELWIWAADGTGRKLGDGASLLVSLSAAPDGRTLATGDHADVVELWDAARGPGPVLRGHAASVDPLAFSADGRLLASGSYDKTVRVWRLDGGEPRVLSGHRTIVRRGARRRRPRRLVRGLGGERRLHPNLGSRRRGRRRLRGPRGRGAGSGAFARRALARLGRPRRHRPPLADRAPRPRPRRRPAAPG